ncbi:MAG: hypothetical protein JWR07_1824 [Nevskia sp.]|nr:hypothetical protein [Nevskia sp.]
MLTIVTACVAGAFALVSALLAWKLRNASDDRASRIAKETQRRSSVEQLYQDVYILFERAMKQVLSAEKFSLFDEFAKTNARIHLLGSTDVAKQYEETSLLLESWSRLHAATNPRRMDVGGVPIVLLQAPDPTAKYKEAASAEYLKLQEQLRVLVGLMRTELTDQT